MTSPKSGPPEEPPHVVIVGGGIAGLAAAWELESWSRTGRLSVDLYEATARVGGTIVTDVRSGSVLEGGPDSFLTTKPEAMALCEELGLTDSLIGTRPSARGAYIYRKGRLHRIPSLFRVGPWASARSVFSTTLLSRSGKLRTALGAGAVHLRPIRTDGRRALGPQLRDRFGNEAVDWLLEPFLAGIHPAPLDLLSPAAVASALPPRWTVGRVEVSRAGSGRSAGVASEVPARRSPGPFASLREGMEQLPRTMAAKMRGAQLHLRQPVRDVRREGNRYRIAGEDGETVLADGVILALSPEAAGRLLGRELPRVVHGLERIRTSDAVVAGFVFERSEVPMALEGSGVLVPARAGLPISAITWLSAKWDRPQPPDGSVAVRVFLRSANDRSGPISEPGSVRLALEGLREVMGIVADPRYATVFAHRAALPWYELGHSERVAAIRREMADWPGAEFAGSSYDGIGIPDAVRSGRAAARRLAARWFAPPSVEVRAA